MIVRIPYDFPDLNKKSCLLLGNGSWEMAVARAIEPYYGEVIVAGEREPGKVLGGVVIITDFLNILDECVITSGVIGVWLDRNPFKYWLQLGVALGSRPEALVVGVDLPPNEPDFYYGGEFAYMAWRRAHQIHKTMSDFEMHLRMAR